MERVKSKEYVLLYSTIPAWLSYQIQALICGNLRRTPRAAEVDWNYTSPRILKTSPTSYDAAFCDSLNTQTRHCQGCWWWYWTSSHLDRSLSLSAGIEHLALYNCFQIHSGQDLRWHYKISRAQFSRKYAVFKQFPSLRWAKSFMPCLITSTVELAHSCVNWVVKYII